jgi:geranylgeranyl pyrophosphate synthase
MMHVYTLTSETNLDIDPFKLTADVKARMIELTSCSFDTWSMQNAQAEKAAHYQINSGGGLLRARLAIHAGISLNLEEQDVIALATAVELLHNASLAHDDLNDRDLTRRGVKTVWSVFGDNIAMCAGNLMLSAGYVSLSSFSVPHLVPKLISLFHQRITSLIHGQCEDLSVQTTPRNDFETYETIAIGKSGSLLSLPLELCFIGAGMDGWLSQVRQATNAFAIGYQILDDIQDVNKDLPREDKPHSLNAVLTLKAAGHTDKAEEMARAISHKYLRAAAVAADQLPNGSGYLLKNIADRLASNPKND